ncbi:hypothetical protein AAFF_G00058110 [Aldrovandia affinis]|uniref:Uncharacterized protein n=1 Tax=Aldrovandia affinis TaxID=143900 RepID=A0AAD7S0K3_9TELE|nr:hypothetical protein AAFF_G00058110 [Aldrovandia affinis]
MGPEGSYGKCTSGSFNVRRRFGPACVAISGMTGRRGRARCPHHRRQQRRAAHSHGTKTSLNALRESVPGGGQSTSDGVAVVSVEDEEVAEELCIRTVLPWSGRGGQLVLINVRGAVYSSDPPAGPRAWAEQLPV